MELPGRVQIIMGYNELHFLWWESITIVFLHTLHCIQCLCLHASDFIGKVQLKRSMWNSTRHPRGDKLCIYLQTIHVYPTMHYGYVLYGFQICSLWTNKSLLKTLPGATGFDIAKAILTEGLVDGFQMEQPYIQVMCSLQVVFHYTDVSGISQSVE